MDTSFFETAGFSMWPFIKQGERLIIKQIPVGELKAGDIILYGDEREHVCHRLVRKTKDEYGCILHTRGDNSSAGPEAVPSEMYQGKVTGMVRDGAIVDLTTFSRRTAGRIIVAFFPLIRFVICGANRMKRWIKFS